MYIHFLFGSAPWIGIVDLCRLIPAVGGSTGEVYSKIQAHCLTRLWLYYTAGDLVERDNRLLPMQVLTTSRRHLPHQRVWEHLILIIRGLGTSEKCNPSSQNDPGSKWQGRGGKARTSHKLSQSSPLFAEDFGRVCNVPTVLTTNKIFSVREPSLPLKMLFET